MLERCKHIFQLSEQQVSLDQFEKHPRKKYPDVKHKHIFIHSTRQGSIQYECITIKKPQLTEKAHTCQLFRQRAASEQQFYVSLCIV